MRDLLSRPPAPGEIAQHLVAAGDQGEQLPRDRIGRRRAGEAAPQVVQGRLPVLPLDGDRPQVEQHERIVRPLGQLSSRILPSRWSFRSRSARSVYPVCRTVMSVHFTGTFARRRAGRICSCTRYVQRTSSRSGNSRI